MHHAHASAGRASARSPVPPSASASPSGSPGPTGSIRTTEQAAELLGIEPNTSIPKVKRHNTDELAVVPGRHDPLSDSYRTLRSLIAFLDAGNQALGDRGSITVVVSPGPSDGKTSVTANVAAALVESSEAHRGGQHRLPPPDPQLPPRRGQRRTRRSQPARRRTRPARTVPRPR